MGSWSSLHEDFVRVKTLMGLERFKVENMLSLKKNRSVATGPGDSPIKNCFGTIEGLSIGYNCTEGFFASQDSYGFTAIYLIFEQEKKVQFFPEQGRSLLRKLI